MGSKKDAAPRPLAKMTSQGSAVPPLKERDRDADKSGRAVSLASADASSHSGSWFVVRLPIRWCEGMAFHNQAQYILHSQYALPHAGA